MMIFHLPGSLIPMPPSPIGRPLTGARGEGLGARVGAREGLRRRVRGSLGGRT